jgi:hypothetical protein
MAPRSDETPTQTQPAVKAPRRSRSTRSAPPATPAPPDPDTDRHPITADDTDGDPEKPTNDRQVAVTGERPPIATATIAQIYKMQGKIEQAEGIYLELLGERPDDPRLQRGLAEVRRLLEEARSATFVPSSDDHVSIERSGDTLRCTFAVTDSGQRRAGLVLDGEGRLTLRLVVFPSQAGKPAQDIQLQSSVGSLTLKPPDRAKLVAASVGLLAEDGSFVSIAHSDSIAISS